MSLQILQINFKYGVSAADYQQAVSPLAGAIAAVPGLRWKIWIINKVESEAGGIFLFDDEASLQAFLEGSVAAQVTTHPALSDFSVKAFGIMEDETGITRGPIQ